MQIDCRDLDCPLPVIKVKEAYESLKDDDFLDVLLNSYSSKENVKRYAKNNCIYLKVKELEKKEALFTLVKGYSCDIEEPQKERKSWVYIIIGSIVSALLASSCCLAPFLFLVFGVSVSSLSFLQVLAPYSKYFSLFSLFALIYLWFDYFINRKKKLLCETWLSKNYLKLLIIGTVLVAIFITYPYWVNYFLDLE